MASLPNNGSNCVTFQDPDGTLYTCNDVIYRPTYYKDEQVYEVVSPAEETAAASTPAASNDQDAEELLLTSPLMRGERVRAVQNALTVIGFNVGTVDGIFGKATDEAVRAFQEWWEIPVTGVVDNATAQAIGEAYAWTISPETTGSTAEVAEGSAEDATAPAADSTQDDGAASATQSDDGAAETQTESGGESQQDDTASDATDSETKEDTTQSD